MEIKCVCGYIHESGLDDKGNWQKNLQGDDEFRVIEGIILRPENCFEDKQIVNLQVCPKCGTVKFEKWA